MTQQTKMTAVEWLVKEIESLITIETFQRWKVLKEQAKQMEKEQHQTSFNKGYDRRNYIHDFEYGGVEYWEEEPKEFEQYYNETYGK